MRTDFIAANEQALREQSRSFAIPILRLDQRFRVPVMVQYNLNKSIDTIEDNPNLSSEEKRQALTDFCNTLETGRASVELQRYMLQCTPSDEAFVFKNHQQIIELLQTLHPAEQQLAKDYTYEMAQGMTEFLSRKIINGADLNAYCYYVAGTVGNYLTDLLKLNGTNIADEIYTILKTNATNFGLFLQKLNVIRDHHEDDIKHEQSYWPRSYLQQDSELINVLNRLCFETLENDVPKAIVYQQNIPPGNETFENFLRFVLTSGLEYLSLLIDNRAVLQAEKIKLPRNFIENLYENVAKLSKADFNAYIETRFAEEMARKKISVGA